MPIPGGWELVAILAVLVLLFGASKLPGAARSIGQSMRIFKAETKGMKSGHDDHDDHDDHERKDRGERAQQPAQDPPQALPASGQQQPSTPAQHQARHNSETR